MPGSVLSERPTRPDDDVLDRVERLHLHLRALAQAGHVDEVAALLAQAACEVARAGCARVQLRDTAAVVPCGAMGCPVCGPPVGLLDDRVQTWPLREGTLRLATEGTDQVTDRLLAWLVEQAALALDRGRRSRSATETVDALLRSERARSELVEVLAHDLRSPMTALHGFAALLAERWSDMDEERRRDLLAMIQRETGRMNRLVEDVTDAVLGPTTTLPLRLAPVDVAGVAADLVVAAQAATPTHVVRCVVAPGTPLARADEDRVSQVLANLLENAARHTPVGTVTLVHVRRDGVGVRVTVADDGPGIGPDDRDRVFARGGRGAAATGNGSGLGLHTARGLAEAMGGALVLDEDGPGATFVLTLPAAGVVR